MSRRHGERQQDYAARAAFALESALATRSYELKMEILKANGVPLPKVEITVACTCSAVPVPHFHEPRRFLALPIPGFHKSATRQATDE